MSRFATNGTPAAAESSRPTVVGTILIANSIRFLHFDEAFHTQIYVLLQDTTQSAPRWHGFELTTMAQGAPNHMRHWIGEPGNVFVVAGRTNLSLDQILSLGEGFIRENRTYNVFGPNCRSFAEHLVSNAANLERGWQGDLPVRYFSAELAQLWTTRYGWLLGHEPRELVAVPQQAVMDVMWRLFNTRQGATLNEQYGELRNSPRYFIFRELGMGNIVIHPFTSENEWQNRMNNWGDARVSYVIRVGGARQIQSLGPNGLAINTLRQFAHGWFDDYYGVMQSFGPYYCIVLMRLLRHRRGATIDEAHGNLTSLPRYFIITEEGTGNIVVYPFEDRNEWQNCMRSWRAARVSYEVRADGAHQVETGGINGAAINTVQGFATSWFGDYIPVVQLILLNQYE